MGGRNVVYSVPLSSVTVQRVLPFRVSFVFTPYHGSWLNQVEIWFGILTSKCLRLRPFRSVAALTDAIYAFVEHWNARMAKPFEWTYSGKVLAA